MGRERIGLDLADRGQVLLLIDASSLFYAAMHLEIEIDYARLLSYLVRDSWLVHAFFYTGLDPANEKQKQFLYWMQRNGYRVIAKDLIHFPDGSIKVNLNVEMAIDMMRLAECCNTVVLVSGDGELAYALDAVAYRGIRTELVCLRSLTSEHLINIADRYIDLASLKSDICKPSRASDRGESGPEMGRGSS
ncbi:NYN domain-containing protein [Leptolyngbya sp. 'hensonii']|nr:NYN domain-containing protein [Leptolyngbya sp. 'hensonii']